MLHPAYRRSYDIASAEGQTVTGAIDHSSIPVRPPASDPPTPEPQSAVSFSESFDSNVTEHPARRSIDMIHALTSNQLYASTSSSLPLPDHVFDTATDIPISEEPLKEKDVEIRHPTPRRFASHTALLQRSSTIASYPRSVFDSPAPPPRSPLRLQRDARIIEGILQPQKPDTPQPKVAPIIQDVKDLRSTVQPIRPTVITDCTGPIKRPKSRGSNSRGQSPYLNTRKEREERTRARKIRDRPVMHISNPIPTRTIDAVVHAPLPVPRHRLKKARPHIQIPDLKPAQLATRASSSASSNASWKKITESTRTPVSAVPSAVTPTSNGEKTGYTPISPTASSGSATAEAMMALSPVMLVAEEIPIPKTKSPPKPARVVVREGKSYAPRPRSASIPRSAMKRRSRQGGHTPSRPGSPSHHYDQDDAPPLPSPPPNRALPPTPPASGSGKPRKDMLSTIADRDKELPLVPPQKIVSKLSRQTQTPHVASQVRKRAPPPAGTPATGTIHARLEALENHNAMLSAALEAVLRTNGAVNDPVYKLLTSPEIQRHPMAWESRLARRSAASQGSSNSNDTAMRLYYDTRREI